MWRFLTQLVRRIPVPLLYLLLAMGFYAPLLLGLRTFPDGDFTHHFLPFSLFQQDAIRNGQLPLWNPHTYSGHPFLADIQAAVFYPVSKLLLLLTLPWDGPGARLYWLQVEAVVQVALAGWFTYLLVRALTGNRWAAFTAGCCFAFSGYLTGYPPLQLAVLRTAIWLPLLLWALYRGMQSPAQWRWWISAALIYATMFFAGHPQTFLHGSYVMGLWLVWLVVTQRIPSQLPREVEDVADNTEEMTSTQRPQTLIPPRRDAHLGMRSTRVHLLTLMARRGRATFGIVVFLMLALALSAAQLLPSVEFTRLSVRANVDYAYVSGGFPLQDTWQLLLPGVFTQFSPLYIGVIGLGLALIGLLVRPPAKIHHSPFAIRNVLLMIFLLFLLLSYGANSFLYPLFYRFAPGWDLFRGQERAAFVVAFSLSVLAGLGAATLPIMPYRLRQLVAVFYAVLVSAGVYSFGLFWQMLERTAINQWHYLAIAVLTILAALVLVVCLALPGWDGRRQWLITGTVLLNLFVVNMGTNLAPSGPVRKTILAPEMVAVQDTVAAQNNVAAGLPGRVYNEYRVYEDYAMRLAANGMDVEDVWGSSPLRLARYAALFDNFPLDRMWRLTGVDTVLTWRRELFAPSTLLAEFPQATDTTYLHTLATDEAAPNPRAWMVDEIRVADDEVALVALADHAINLEQVGFLSPMFDESGSVTDSERVPPGREGEAALALSAGAPGEHVIELTRLSPQALEINVYSEAGGLLVISENWIPGWRIEQVHCPVPTTTCATGDSPIETLPLLQPLRANLTLIGVVVPKDEVTFTLRYDPASVRWGLWISGGTLALLALVGLWRWRSVHGKGALGKGALPS